MKNIIYYLNPVLKNKFFKPIRNRKDIISILLESMRHILSGYKVPQEKSCGQMQLYCGKTSRLIYISDNKYFSINFPFFIDNSKDCFIYGKNRFEIDNKVISEISKINMEINFNNTNSFSSFFDIIVDIVDDEKIWYVFFELLTFEEGYIRFDNDMEHTSLTHPQYHIDLFYNDHNKIKFGLVNNFDDVSFLDLIISNDIYFLDKNDCKREG